jgi:hypothetical protein
MNQDEKAEHIKELNRKRAQKYYNSKRAIIAERRKSQREAKKNFIIIYPNPTREQLKLMFINKLKEKYPNLKENSIVIYASCLNYIVFNLLKVKDNLYFEMFDDQDKIIKLLKDDPTKDAGQRKIYWNSLKKISNINDKYNKEFNEDIKTDKQQRLLHQKTEKQNNNWVTEQLINDKFTEYYTKYKHLMTQDELTLKEYQNLQQLLIIGLYSKLQGAPRLMEFTEMKIRKFNKNTDNYYDGSYFHYNKFKTVSTEGPKKELVPEILKGIVDSLISINETENLLVDNKLNKLSNVTLNQRINKIFGLKVGCNIMRHARISELYTNINMKTITDNANKYNHSIETHLSYIKK